MINNKKQNLTINLKRRQLIQSVWAAPIVTAITIPAHAQTSALGVGRSNISQGPGSNRPARVCIVSDTGHYNVAPVAFSFEPDPGAGVPFTAQLFIGGELVDNGSGETEVDGSGTYAFIRFKGQSLGAEPGDDVSLSITVEGFQPILGSNQLNDCENCVADPDENPDTENCTPQEIFSSF